ncbi:MAG: sulfatase-like hydrolase/transferase [Pirellulaceae bacterium]
MISRTIRLSCLFALAAIAAFGPGRAVHAAQQPNLLFVFADDQAFDTIAAMGNEEIETPNLDRLARRGVTFSRAYNQGGWHGAVCVASRTMLNTGRYLWHARDDEPRLKDHYQAKGLMWSQILAKAGYETFFTGKWHVKADADKVFQTARHVRGGMPKQTPEGYNRPIPGKEDVWRPWDTSKGGFWEGGKHWSEVVGDDAIDYLTQASQTERPFFMYLAFNAPHDPRQSPKEYVDKYPLEKISLPQPFQEEYPLNIGANRIRDEQLAPFPRTEYAVKVNRQEYYAIITHMDAQIGRILDKLEETGQADNTYIFFTADHGLACGHHGLMGKQNMHDHSVRVPFMVVGPKVPADKRIDTPIYLQDVMPTTLQLAGVEQPEHVEFHSLLPILGGESEGAYDSVYGAYVDVQRMVTVGDDKLIVYPKIGKVLLYDLGDDPLETNNLADTPAGKKKVAKLLSELKSWQAKVGDALEIDASKLR